jgi:3-oxoacyl-[acyl-carrier protein] reductase
MVLIKIGGRIIFISTSLTQASTVLPNALTYIATKGAIEQASRALAKDLAPKGITVNVSDQLALHSMKKH